MKITPRAIALLVVLALPLAARGGEAAAPRLEIGFGRACLDTEQKGVSLAGYGGRGLLPHRGVHDPIYVKVMVVRTPEKAVALVTADLIGVQRTMLEALAERGFPEHVELDPADVVLCASHTHAGYGSLAQATGAPALDILLFATCGNFRPAFFDEVVGKVRGAIVEAWDDLAPARIGIDSREVPGLARNRGKSGGVTDPEIGVIKVTDPRGKLRGLVVNFTAHPTILGADNLLASAGYPGAVQRHLEERFEGAMALFTNGAEGDQSVKSPPGDYADAWAKVDATGKRLAEHVARIQEDIEVVDRIEVATRGAELAFPVPAEEHRKHYEGGQPKSLFRNLILGDVLFLGLPGEPCCQIGLDLKAAARERGFRRKSVG